MISDLARLFAKFRDIDNFENDVAFFRTKVPTVAPEAYLIILFKPTCPEIVAEVGQELDFPPPLYEFYRHWNGALLFVPSVAIRGCLSAHYLLDRTGGFRLPPFDIRDINREFLTQLDSRNLVCFASYTVDRSLVCMDRTSQHIVCFEGENFGKIRQTWNGLDEWLGSEVHRLSLLFDENGNRLVKEVEILPSGKVPTIR